MSLWSDPSPRRPFAGPRLARPGHLESVERLRDWTRARFALAAAQPVVVTESTPALPGFPPRETTVAFWTADGIRHHFRFFKAVGEVAEDDLPPAWMKAALADSPGTACDCC